MINFNPRITLMTQNDGRDLCMPRKQRNEFLVYLDRFSKYLKCLRNFEKRSKLTKIAIVFRPIQFPSKILQLLLK